VSQKPRCGFDLAARTYEGFLSPFPIIATVIVLTLPISDFLIHGINEYVARSSRGTAKLNKTH